VPLLLADGDHRYLYATGTAPIAQADAQGTAYLHGDVIGSVRSVTDEDGAVLAEADYAPYGAVVGDEETSVTSVTRFGFGGEYTDPTGLVYLRARYYDPATAQFTSLDPLRDLSLSLSTATRCSSSTR
jgi:RHS repeat-associated protein